MSIKDELQKLKEPDIWSLMLFALFKVKDIPEYSSLCELAYILDKKNMLKLCEYFGGCTITIPTIDELELLVYGLLMYQYIHIEHLTYDEAVELITRNNVDIKLVKQHYNKIYEVLSQYDIVTRAR